MKTFKEIIVVVLFTMTSCGKEFLDTKRNADQVVPSTIQDYQALLDNKDLMNQFQAFELSLIGTDEYLISDKVWENDLIGNWLYMKKAYIWADDVFEEKESRDWNQAYQRILYANMALDVEKIIPSEAEQAAWNNVKGSALFFRAYNYYQLIQVFCEPYNIQTVDVDLGVPLKLDYDVTLKVGRGKLSDVYNQMIRDLEMSASLLPEKAESIFRPSKMAANHLLAKIYLNMGNYDLAIAHADAALKVYNRLLDFNTLDLVSQNTFPRNDYSMTHPEVFFYSSGMNIRMHAFSRVNIPDYIFELYDEGDLRKEAYFVKQGDGRRAFKGSYHFQGDIMFTGFATDELWLIHAECRARLGDLKGAMEDLNYLLRHRYKLGDFAIRIFNDPEKVLDFILMERRKQLFMRGVRWEDLRRLNKEPRFATTLKRDVGGRQYELPLNDPKWIWLLPKNEIALNGLEQNRR